MIEFIFSFVIYVLIALLLIAIGIGQIKSKTPVGFYTHEQAPRKQDITDIETWNNYYRSITYCNVVSCEVKEEVL